jgi:hypothetical protein
MGETYTIKLEELADREAIRDCLCRSAMANDLRDIELWKSVYWPDGHEDHGPMFIGNAHDFVEAVTPMVDEAMESVWHQMGMPLIRIDGARANVMTYGQAYTRMRATAQREAWNLLVGVRYVDVFEKRDGEWRILNRVTQPDWMCEVPDLRDPFPAPPAKADPVRSLFSGAAALDTPCRVAR